MVDFDCCDLIALSRKVFMNAIVDSFLKLYKIEETKPVQN